MPPVAQHRRLMPLADRGPLRVMFMTTSMPVGGAETLLVNLIRRLDRQRFLPEICCLKTLGPLGAEMAREVPVFAGLLTHKYDLRILPRLVRLLRARRIDAVVTVGAGDKMFWGRLAGWRARVPVILSALHSTGWPDSVGRLNRLLTPITDGFIGVADAHGKHLVDGEHFPINKVFVIPNGVDSARFAAGDGTFLRRTLGLDHQTPLVGIVAALRPEKNHRLFLEVAARVLARQPLARFVVVGEGPERSALEEYARRLNLAAAVFFLGSCHDVPDILSALDVFVLTSRMEANPVSIIEAMASGRPVVVPKLGSIPDVVEDGVSGWLVPPGDADAAAEKTLYLLEHPSERERMGRVGQEQARKNWSLDRMVSGYEELLVHLYEMKCPRAPWLNDAASAASPSFPDQRSTSDEK